jgi:phosphotriesterase-related protein
MFEAAALAQRRTGAPISTHTSGGTHGAQQLELLLGFGADPRRILIGHLDAGAQALGACVAVARRGAYVGIDRVGDPSQGSDDERERLVLALAERGLLDRVLLSQDVAGRSRLLAAGGSGYTAVLADFAPRLRERGLTHQQIELLLVHNPRRFLAFGRSSSPARGIEWG